MPRYLIIDESGRLLADTATAAEIGMDHILRGGSWAGQSVDSVGDDLSPLEAVRWLEEARGLYGRSYEMIDRLPDGASGYDVFRADDLEETPPIRDLRDPAATDAVRRHCDHVATVRVLDRSR
jgi:hypothetical protein